MALAAVVVMAGLDHRERIAAAEDAAVAARAAGRRGRAVEERCIAGEGVAAAGAHYRWERRRRGSSLLPVEAGAGCVEGSLVGGCRLGWRKQR